jgi:hypothetical protein
VRHPLVRLAAVGLVCGLLGCAKYPVDPSERDLLSLERVWQYCTAFSIYQDNVPAEAEALAMESPLQIMASLHDTLYSHAYGQRYEFARYEPLAQSGLGRVSASAALSDAAPTVYFKKLTASTAYLRIGAFKEKTVGEIKAIGASEVGATPNLIIDLVQNPGGSLDAATEIVDILLPENTAYLVQRYRRNILSVGGAMATQTDTLRAKRTVDSLTNWEGRNVVVLIDGMTASAAEILAVALRDGQPAASYLMGDLSFGKAIGQYIFYFFGVDYMLEVTGFRFHRVSGPDYHEKGIAPDQALSTSGSLDERIARWILAAGNHLESNFSSHLLSPAIIQTVVSDRSGISNNFGMVPSRAAGVAGLSARPLGYKLLTQTQFPLF